MPVYKMSYDKRIHNSTAQITKLYEDLNKLRMDALEVLLIRDSHPNVSISDTEKSIKKFIYKWLKVNRTINNNSSEELFQQIKNFSISKHVDNEWVKLDFEILHPQLRIYE